MKRNRPNAVSIRSDRAVVALVTAGTDSGMNHLARPAMYDAFHEVANLSAPDGASRVYDVVGNICESADFFARDRALPAISNGDLLGIMDVGAYGISMSSQYNMRPLPAEIVIGMDGVPRCVRERLSAADLIDRFLRDEVG